MYADTITDSMTTAIDETNRRRVKQLAYNAEHGIDPQPLRKKIADITDLIASEAADTEALLAGGGQGGRAGARRPRWAPAGSRRALATSRCRRPSWRRSSPT